MTVLLDTLSLAWCGITTAFLAVRIVAYVTLVCWAWYAIIEEHVYSRRHQEELHASRTYHGKVPVVRTRLGDGIHTTQPRSPQSTQGMAPVNKEGAGYGHPNLYRASSSLTASTDETVSSDASSVADWSIWDAESAASDPLDMDAADPPQSKTPSFPSGPSFTAADTPLPPIANPAPPPHARPHVPRPVPVTVSKLGPSPNSRQFDAKGDRAKEVAGEGADVAPAAVGAAGADAGDASVLLQAGASMAGGDIVQEPAKERVRHTRHGRRKKEKKPYLVRKMEKWVYKPIHDKYEKMGFMTYKGFGRMGRRFERGLRVTGAQLSTAMNTAGLVALESVDHLIKKWVMFLGVVAALSFALLPLPSSAVLEVRLVQPVA